MKTIKHLAILTASLLWGLCACGQKQAVPESLVDVKKTVFQLDSIAGAMHWQEQLESSDDSIRLVHEAWRSWAEFKRLVDADEYEKAIDFHNDNKTYFQVLLPNSSLRYEFISEVLTPMLLEYKDFNYAANEIIDLLKFEKTLEELSITKGKNDPNCIPEVYTYVINDLGAALATIGKMDEAHDLWKDIANAIYMRTRNALYASFNGAGYAASLYLQEGMTDQAINIWEDFKAFVEEFKSDFDKEEVAECMATIDQILLDLSNRAL